jgi:hypothetical protein
VRGAPRRLCRSGCTLFPIGALLYHIQSIHRTADDERCNRLPSSPQTTPHTTPASCFLRLPPASRAVLLETLTSNLESLTVSAENLLEEWATATAEAVAAHKAALKMHVFLLHCVATQAQEEAERAGPAGAAGGKGARGGGAAGELVSWFG